MKRLPYKALVFDWDGTLMNSVQKIVNCLRASIELCGLQARDQQQLSYIIGLGLSEAIQYLYPDISEHDFTRLRAAYREQFLLKDQTSSMLFDGVSEMLSTLDAQGYFLAIATGKGRPALNQVLAESGVQDFFTVSRCASETASKPNPLMLQQIIDYLGIDQREALMIGDTVFDMQMAQNLGVERIAVSYGAHTREQLAKHAPLAILEDITHLRPWLDARL